MSAPALDGIHHVKLPVRDLARSLEWYESRLGYLASAEFLERGELKGVSMRHPNGGPEFALRLDPDRAAAAAGFDYFAIGVPSREAIDDLAARLSALGESHAGVRLATIGWILQDLRDPDGHEVRFYTTTHDREPPADGVLRSENPREACEIAAAADASTRPSAGASDTRPTTKPYCGSPRRTRKDPIMTTDTHTPETANPITAVAVAAMHVMASSSREEFDAIFTSDAFNRESDQEPPDTRGTGPAAFFATSRWLQEAFSDLAWEIHDVAHQGELVAIHATMSGRQTGFFVSYRPDGAVQASFAPTGRSLAVTQSHWFRIKDGKVTEHWANRDDLGMGIQLGWGPPAA